MLNDEQKVEPTSENGNSTKPNVSSSADDAYLDANIVEARTDFDKACDLYRSYVGKAETREERIGE